MTAEQDAALARVRRARKARERAEAEWRAAIIDAWKPRPQEDPSLPDKQLCSLRAISDAAGVVHTRILKIIRA